MEKPLEIEGYWNVIPHIKKISFAGSKIQIELQDGRTVVASINQFPSIKKLKTEQRKKWFLFGNGFSFEDCNEVYHIEQILGNYNNYRHEA